MCLSRDPFVPNMVAVRAEESCGFELEKRPQTPGFDQIKRTCQIKHSCLPDTVLRFFLDSHEIGLNNHDKQAGVIS